MPKNISRRKLIQKLIKLGFSGPFPGGRHLYVVKGVFKVRIPNPHQKDISKSLVMKIIHQAGISVEDWENI
jgi:predicted RNA binding protein YcfA (HicA-like mRNA interferase family)